MGAVPARPLGAPPPANLNHSLSPRPVNGPSRSVGQGARGTRPGDSLTPK
jgi:hypothetical protein